jgi:hypothetical protein
MFFIKFKSNNNNNKVMIVMIKKINNNKNINNRCNRKLKFIVTYELLRYKMNQIFISFELCLSLYVTKVYKGFESETHAFQMFYQLESNLLLIILPIFHR